MAIVSNTMLATSLCALLVCIMLLSDSPMIHASFDCSKVSKPLVSCVPYLKGEATKPSPACCNGCKSLLKTETTKADRQGACSCLKSLAGKVGVKDGPAKALPGKCGFKFPYVISSSVDCSKVN
ncbi:Non-specific lipid-transfer protein-like protein [Drosera capensis]